MTRSGPWSMRTAMALWMLPGALVASTHCGGISEEERVFVTDGPSGGAAGSAGGPPSAGAAAASDSGGAGAAGASGFGGGGDVGGEGGAGGGGEGGAGGEAGEPNRCPKTGDNARGGLELVTLSTTCAASYGDAAFSRLTPDGRYVTFDSDASDLVAQDSNGLSDGFLFDLDTRELELISKQYLGERPAAGYSALLVPSDDARYVAFASFSHDLTPSLPPEGIWVYVRDRQQGTTRRLTADYACTYGIDMSGDGAFLVAQGYTNCQGGFEPGDYESTISYDLEGGGRRRLGVVGDESDNYRPALSRDGRFTLWATRPPMTRGQRTSQLSLHDRTTDTIETLPVVAYAFESTDISDSGNFVAFSQNGQVYRYDRERQELVLVSKNGDGAPGDGTSTQVSMSGDGRFLAFRSTASDLVEGDTNQVADILLYDGESDSLERLSLAADGSEADDDSRYPHIAGDASKVSFASKARNLLPLATSGDYQLYVRTIRASR